MSLSTLETPRPYADTILSDEADRLRAEYGRVDADTLVAVTASRLLDDARDGRPEAIATLAAAVPDVDALIAAQLERALTKRLDGMALA